MQHLEQNKFNEVNAALVSACSQLFADKEEIIANAQLIRDALCAVCQFDDNAVLRHSDNNKWYGLVMAVGRDKLGLSGDGTVDVLNRR